MRLDFSRSHRDAKSSQGLPRPNYDDGVAPRRLFIAARAAPNDRPYFFVSTKAPVTYGVAAAHYTIFSQAIWSIGIFWTKLKLFWKKQRESATGFGRHGAINPAAKRRNDMADKWSPGAKESRPIAPAGDEAGRGYRDRMRRTGSSTRAEDYREMVVDP